ncbi:N-acetyl-D-Glu racemase DgcA [Mesorhizobium sp. RMAD-H1]|uniref:N-acetyl-D-Glu racemase DgcA n=1 Tax=Mesorhizobium sp. RMAD-H1 TaxID=2587065 RepID=UPI00161DD5F4|nr:N-acetyl-D-Glu racemase DgcA [Mesorhizobium sp. RMAD-H1]MBB2970561.1 L-alanine-DL-glutamate epimerase-like enolase superfamily enzyme [Mesorhizobium sp. RMAD-H1]
MGINLQIQRDRYPIAGSFTISRGSKTAADVIVCTLSDGNFVGRGECVPYARYGESLESVTAEIETVRDAIVQGAARHDLLTLMRPGAARNAVDCALWDFEAKRAGRRVAQAISAEPPRPLTTAITISMGDPETMAEAARALSGHPVIKVKIGGENDAARIHAVAEAAPNSRIILDANEGWTEENFRKNMMIAAEAGIALIEQPLPAGKDELLAATPRPVPVCADESAHTSEGLGDLAGRYDAVNIKLDKTGGLTEALAMRRRARELGLGVMVGCMVGTSLAMAPAVLLAQDADYVDLDGPLLLERDRSPGLVYDGMTVYPPEQDLWG